MKITTTNKSLAAVPKGYTIVRLTEKGVGKFLEKDGVTELLISIGKFKAVTHRTFRTHVRGIVQSAKQHKLEKIALELDFALFPKLKEYGEAWMYAALAENLLLADYEYTKYKSKPSKYALKEVLVTGIGKKEQKDGIFRGTTIAKYVNMCRDISNTPGGDMTPELLGKAAKTALKGTKATVSVLDTKAVEKLKMGALLGVGKGSKDTPRFIIVEYWGKGRPRATGKKPGTDAPIVFVGKGVTFDTGGLQVKPGMAMYEMHMDMSGGAAVIAAIGAIASLGIKKNVVGLIPAAENAISGDSIRPGDVLTSMSGKTIDVLHTDAEGRLILADALHYARKYNPRLVVDVATLTGAALVAMGQHAHAIMTKDRDLEDTLRDLGEESGDYVAPLPLWDEFKQYTKGVHGDIANIPPGDSRYGGTINGATFLSHFTKGMKWVHIDMAPRMTAAPGDKLTKGATGEPTRLLVHIAEKL